MDLPGTSIRRPVLAIVLSTMLVIFGAVGFMLLPVREYPAVDPPVVTISTSYSGASPDVIDSQITEPLEGVINGISGIRTISSTSREGGSSIRVEFTLDTDLEAAANDVRDKVSQAINRLPDDADPPSVEKADADSAPIIFMTLQSDKRSILEVSKIADTVVKERVQTIPGVSSVRIWGEKRLAMRLWMDPAKMVAHDVTPQDVQAALTSQNVDLPSGRIEGNTVELSVRTEGKLTTPGEFNGLIIREQNGRKIRFDDIGYAELGPEDLYRSLKKDMLPMVGIAVIPQPNTNAIAIADEFYKRFESIRKELPPDFTMEIGYDFTKFVRQSISEVQETLLIAFLLVALIIYLFLRDWRSTIIPILAIPVSIISAFFVMYVAGYSINVLTLVGIVLAIGLVCDDAIVVLENIYSKIEQGMAPLEAAIKGSKEIYFAVISTTLTLAMVFMPIVFLQGLTGRLFREFGVTIVAAVIASSFVALTLSPMMCRFVLKRGAKHSKFHRLTEPFYVWMTGVYRWFLVGFIRLRWLVAPIIAGVVTMIVVIGARVPSELAPLEDRSNIRVNVRAPEGVGFEYTSFYLDQVATWVSDNIPEISGTFSLMGVGGNNSSNTGTQNIYLKDPKDRERSQEQIFQQISAGLGSFHALRIFPSQPPTIGDRRGGQPLQYVLQAPSMAHMIEVLPKFMEEASKSPVLRFVDADLKINRPQMTVEIERDRAAEQDVSIAEIARVLQLSYSGTRLGYFINDGKQYQIIGQVNRADRDDPGDLRRLHVRSRGGKLVSLDGLVTYRENASPAAIYRFDRYVSATISGSLAEGFTLGDGINALDEVAERLLPENFSTSLSGQSRDFADSSSSLLFAFLMALVLIYLVLAAQFESFIDPLIILFTVPLSVAGALLSLWVFGMTLNVFSQIGIIMLVGLVTKNGILIVEFANHRKEDGLPKIEAVIDAAVARFRPILMTSLSTILGILPIALSIGGSTGSRQSLGIAVVGGLIFSGFLTLFIVPAVYCFLSSAKRRSSEEPLSITEDSGTNPLELAKV